MEEQDLPAELQESVYEAVGRRVKVELKVRVQLEVKDKVENRILVLASHRLLLLSARVPVKVEQSFSLLDLQGVNSNKPSQLALEHERGCWLLRSAEVDDIIAQIGRCLQRICPGAPPTKLLKLSLKPPERAAPLLERWGNSKPELGPCGGFSHQYWCVCDHLGLPYRDEVQWDVDTIYLSQDMRELTLQDFIHLDNRDLVPIIAALEFNQWFSKLCVKDHKLSSEASEALLRVVARSSRLEELVLDNAGLRSDFAQKFAAALSHNPASALHSLTLSNNSLEDKGAAALAAQFAKLPLGLKRLNLCRTGLSPKGVNSVCQSLSSNPVISSSLKELSLSANSLRGDDLQQLHSFLSEANVLETLDVSHSDCSVEQLCSSLLRGSLQHLSVLNMSKCVFSHRKLKELPSGFKQFFGSALNLSSVSLSGTKLPLEALKALLLGLGCNPSLSNVSLDLSGCDLRSPGAQVLEGCIAEIPNISSLDVSDNGLDLDLLTLLQWISKNRSIKHLALGKNFSGIKSKNVSQVLDNLVHLIQEEESPLSSLSLADSRLKSDLSIFLNALGSNASLTRLDISGNAMGDLGAKILAKALQINTKLRTVLWDRNGVSAQGLQDVASALEKNYTIRFMPVPIADAAQALKTNPEKTEDALLKMEQFLLRNHETRKYLQEQNYRLQQGIVTTTTQQMVDTMCVKVQDHLNSLRFTESPSVQDDVKRAQRLIQDARNSKTLLPSLYHLQNNASQGPCVGAIQDTLESMAGEVTRVMEQQLQVLLELMVKAAQTVCPHVMQRSSLQQELLQKGAKKMSVPQSFICTTLLQQSGADILNKISEVKLSLASFLSDRIVDEILESLSKSRLTLSEHVSRKGRPLELDSETQVIDETVIRTEPPRETPSPRETPAPRETPSLRETPSPREPSTQEGEESVAPAAPARVDSGLTRSKRKSILVRMLRPVSVAFEALDLDKTKLEKMHSVKEMEFDLDKALEEVPIHVEDTPPLSPEAPPPLSAEAPPPAPAEAPPPDLPPLQVQTLPHQTKSRPRPKKRSRPTRPKRSVAPPAAAAEPELSSHMGKVDEGIEEFFSKAVSRLSFRRPVAPVPPVVPVARSASAEGEKKRESRRSGFFNYIKSRTSRSEKSHGAAAITPPASSSAAAVNGANHSATAPPTAPAEDLPPVSPPPHDALQEEAESEEAESERGGADSQPDALPPRLRGVPMLGAGLMGAGLMAEMKAKLAAQKSEAESKATDSDEEAAEVRPEPPEEPEEPAEPRPEPAPRSRTRTSTSGGTQSPDISPDTSSISPSPTSIISNTSPSPTTSPNISPDISSTISISPISPGPTSNTRTSTSGGPQSPDISLDTTCNISNTSTSSISLSVSPQEAPLPAPRLKRAPSQPDRETPPSPAISESDGDAFESPVDLGDGGVRAWSSLKRSQRTESEQSDERERAQSLPNYARAVGGADPGSAEEEADPEAERGGAKD